MVACLHLAHSESSCPEHCVPKDKQQIRVVVNIDASTLTNDMVLDINFHPEKNFHHECTVNGLRMKTASDDTLKNQLTHNASLLSHQSSSSAEENASSHQKYHETNSNEQAQKDQNIQPSRPIQNEQSNSNYTEGQSKKSSRGMRHELGKKSMELGRKSGINTSDKDKLNLPKMSKPKLGGFSKEFESPIISGVKDPLKPSQPSQPVQPS